MSNIDLTNRPTEPPGWDEFEKHLHRKLSRMGYRQLIDKLYNGTFDNLSKEPLFPHSNDSRTNAASGTAYAQDQIMRLNERIRELELENQNYRLEKIEEDYLRHNNPALQEAWEQYQIVKKLCK